MQTTITEVSPVECEFEVQAGAEELAPELNRALKAQRSRADMKGFRKGKVPLSLVKKMYGQQIGLEIAQKFTQEAFEEKIDATDDIEVLGTPEMTELDYEPEGDLRAVVRFGIRPEVELKDVSEEEISKLAYEVTEEEIDDQIENLRREEAMLRPTDEGAGETDHVTFDLQELDAETDTPIVGKKDEDQRFFMDSPEVEQNPMIKELRDALKGAQAGDTVRFTFSHDQAHGDHPGQAHAHRFEATVKEVKERELPDVDDAFVEEVTDGAFASVEDFRAEIRRQLRENWENSSREVLQGQIVERMLEMHPLPIPPSVVETFLDSFVEDVKRRNEGELPENFDEQAFREENRSEAHKQAHWMLLRDKVVEEENLEATDEDLRAFFEVQAQSDERISPEQLRSFYQSSQMMGQVRQQVLSEKVFDALERRFNVVEKDRETFEQEIEEQRRAAEAQMTGEQSGGAGASPAGEASSEDEAETTTGESPLIVGGEE